MLWVVGVLNFAGFCLPACNRELDVQQSYDFALQTMPVQKDIKKGETAEIRCSLKRGGELCRQPIHPPLLSARGQRCPKNGRWLGLQVQRPLSPREGGVSLVLHLAVSRPTDYRRVHR